MAPTAPHTAAEPPSARSALAAIAREASGPLAQLEARLDAPLRTRFDAANRALAEATRRGGLVAVGTVLEEVAGGLAAESPLQRNLIARCLVLVRLARLPEARPAFAVPAALWPLVESSLAALAAAAATGDGMDLSDDLLAKDIVAATLRALPHDGSIATRQVIRPFTESRFASPRDRAALARYLGRTFWTRRPYLTHHIWREIRDAYRRPPERRMAMNARILAANPDVAGVLFTGWPTDPALRGLTPHLAARFDGYLAVAGRRFRTYTSEESAELALSSSARRRAAFEAGDYTPRCHAIIQRRDELLAWHAGQPPDEAGH